MHSLVAGVIVGFVSATGSGEPLPFADVTMQPLGQRALTDAGGRFQWSTVPSGPVTLTVRRIGYAPTTISLTIIDGRTDTVRVALSPISIRLDAVKTSDTQCGGRYTADTAVVTILQQVQLNAERYRLLTRDYPFVTTMERTMADESVTPAAVGVRRQRRDVRIDTIPLSHASARPYEPGKIVSRPAADDDGDIQGRVRIPTLADFADSAFVAVHCFRYAGLTADGDGRRIRVDFTPIASFRESDVSGSLFMDPATFQITRSMLELSLTTLSGSIWDVRADTRFQELWPGIAILAHVCGRTMLAQNTQTARVGGRVVRLGRSAVEEQRALDIEFDRASPDLGPRTRTIQTRVVSCE